MQKDDVIYKTEKLESPTHLRIREQLGVSGNSQAGKITMEDAYIIVLTV